MAPISILCPSLLLLTAGLWNLVHGDNITTPVAYPFYSRPDLDSVVLNITLHNDSYISPGYIFLAPYQVDNPGPYLFDNEGNLVWSGYAQAGPAASHDFRVCSWNGSDHLCMYQGNQGLGYSRGHDLIMDNTFNIVKSVQTGGGLPPADQHEFNTLTTGQTALMTVYHPLQYDLASYNITSGQGWIMEGVFQEVDTMTEEVMFEWHSLDHVDPSASYVLPNTTDVSGDGLTKNTAWDYFHINAVDKTSDGDYLVSSRHTEALFKISATDGPIIWQLGGKHSDFRQNYNFSYQHDVRFRSANSTTTIISIFDNAYNGFNGTANFSQGKVLAVDNATMNSTELITYGIPHPQGPNDPTGGLLSASQGNLQFLPNGNAFIGWGSNCFISESTPDGMPVLTGHFATTGGLHYRAYKFNFSSNPTDQPALYSYAHNTSAPTSFYSSWNGATEVANWTYYGGASLASMERLSTTAKNGFETIAEQPDFYQYTMVEAVAANGTALRNSSVIKTFVPGTQLASVCTQSQCPLIGTFDAPTTPQSPGSDLGSLGSLVTGHSWLLHVLVALLIGWIVR